MSRDDHYQVAVIRDRDLILNTQEHGVCYFNMATVAAEVGFKGTLNITNLNLIQDVHPARQQYSVIGLFNIDKLLLVMSQSATSKRICVQIRDPDNDYEQVKEVFINCEALILKSI